MYSVKREFKSYFTFQNFLCFAKFHFENRGRGNKRSCAESQKYMASEMGLKKRLIHLENGHFSCESTVNKFWSRRPGDARICKLPIRVLCYIIATLGCCLLSKRLFLLVCKSLYLRALFFEEAFGRTKYRVERSGE